MNIRQLRTNETSKANQLIADFAKDVNAECQHVGDTEQYESIAHRHFDDVTFGLSVFMMLFLIASVIATAFYTVR
jgi:hypothetical protein